MDSGPDASCVNVSSAAFLLFCRQIFVVVLRFLLSSLISLQ